NRSLPRRRQVGPNGPAPPRRSDVPRRAAGYVFKPWREVVRPRRIHATLSGALFAIVRNDAAIFGRHRSDADLGAFQFLHTCGELLKQVSNLLPRAVAKVHVQSLACVEGKSRSRHVRLLRVERSEVENLRTWRPRAYSTVTLLARFRGLSTSHPRSTAM